MQRDLLKKIGSLTISILLISLILFVLMPPATAVYVNPGTPSSSPVNKGTTITFHDANLTIRGAEKIPVNFLNFTIFNSNDLSVAWVNFSIDGTEIEDYPTGKFTVTRTTEIDSNWYGYGYRSGENESNHGNYDFGYGYGYGYGEDALTDITILYDITYITHTTGTFYAKLFVNASTYTYESDESTPFTVNYGGGGYSPSNPTLPPGIKVSQDILNTILIDYGVSLTNPFYANDTNGDGAIDTFTDPNHKLIAVRFVNISDHASFLISTNEDSIPEFFWDTTSNTITSVDHSIGVIIDIVNNTDAKTITMTISVEKTNWIYIEVTDLYPDNPDLIVKTADGRTISKEMIWREDGKVFILDDSVIEYLLIYSYTEGFLFDVIVELTPDSVEVGEDISALITLINVGEPGLVNGTVEYALYKGGEIVWSSIENVSVLSQKTYTKTISTDGLNPGSYTYKVIYSYTGGQTASAQGIFTVNAPQQPLSENILLWAIIIIIIVIIVIIAVLFKLGYLYDEDKKK